MEINLLMVRTKFLCRLRVLDNNNNNLFTMRNKIQFKKKQVLIDFWLNISYTVS